MYFVTKELFSITKNRKFHNGRNYEANCGRYIEDYRKVPVVLGGYIENLQFISSHGHVEPVLFSRYNPANLANLERYVEMQSRENTYDLEANLAVLKLYQFNPEKFNADITCQILLKALTNYPHTDFTLCKCLLLESVVSVPTTKCE